MSFPAGPHSVDRSVPAWRRDTKRHDHDRPDVLVVVFWSGWDYEA
jgi:hypothetical protein